MGKWHAHAQWSGAAAPGSGAQTPGSFGSRIVNRQLAAKLHCQSAGKTEDQAACGTGSNAGSPRLSHSAVAAALCRLIQERIANSAMEIFASACILSRLDAELQSARQNGSAKPPEHRAAELFLRQSFARIRRFLADMSGNDDRELLATADAVPGKAPKASLNGRVMQ